MFELDLELDFIVKTCKIEPQIDPSSLRVMKISIKNSKIELSFKKRISGVKFKNLFFGPIFRFGIRIQEKSDSQQLRKAEGACTENEDILEGPLNESTYTHMMISDLTFVN